MSSKNGIAEKEQKEIIVPETIEEVGASAAAGIDYNEKGLPSGEYQFGNPAKLASSVNSGIIATRSSASISKPADPRSAFPNPDMVLKNTNRRLEENANLLYDPHVAAVVQSRKAGVLSLEYQILGEEVEDQIVEFVTDIFERFDMPKIIADILEAPLYGYKPIEIVWKTTPEKIYPIALVGKPVQWFYYDWNNLFRFRYKGKTTGVLVPARKFLVPKHEASYNNPYGISLLSKCYWAAFYKRNVNQYWNVFNEKYGMPYIHGKVPMKGDIDELFDNLETLIKDGVIVTEGEGYGIELIKGGEQKSNELYQQFILYQNSEISKVILSQTLTTEQGSTGSYAMSNTHLQVRQDVIDADKKIVEQTFNKLIRWIIDLNFGYDIKAPKFIMFQEDEVNAELANVVGTLSTNAGVKFNKKFFTSNFGFKEDEFDLADSTPIPGSAFASAEPEPIGNAAELAKSTNKVIKLINKEIGKANSYEEARTIINNILAQIDSADQEEALYKAIVLGNASGQLEEGINLKNQITEDDE